MTESLALTQCYMNGEWLTLEAKTTTEIFNSATGERIGRTPMLGSSETDRAIRAAHAAFPGWRATPTIDRIQPLFKLKALLEEHAEDLAKMITIEHGKTLVEARGSVRRGIQMVETACGMPSLLMGDVFEDIARGIDSQSIRRPMGVFAGITPFNFPAMVAFWFWPFAVAAGNTYVLKPSERVPLTQVKIFELIARAGFPKGVINMVHGGKEVVNTLCTHPLVKGVSFVGSTPVAKHVYTLGTSNGKRVQALGGAKNFMVVLPDALMDSSVKTALESIIGCAGERCLAGSVIVSVGDKTYQDVATRITALARDVSVGNGLDSGTQMGPLISKAAVERVSKLIQSAVDQGAQVLLDGRETVKSRKDLQNGYFLCPTVLGGITENMTIAKEEVFGPVVLLAKTQTFDEAIAWINRNPFANTTTLFTSNGAAARKFCYEVDPSMIGINIGVPAPMSFFSFGGSKDSFFGDVKAHGKECITFFTDSKITIQRWMSEASIW